MEPNDEIQEQQERAEEDFNSIIEAKCSSKGGGSRIQHGGARSIEEWTNRANLKFISFLDTDPNPNPAADPNDRSILLFCWLILFVEIVLILKLHTDDLYNDDDDEMDRIETVIVECITTNLNDKDLLLAYFRSIFGGTFGEQVATAVCAGAAGYSATYLPLFINLLHSALTDSGTMVANAITFVSGYLPAPIYVAVGAVSGYVSSPSGLIAMGFIVYGFLRHRHTPPPSQETLRHMRDIVPQESLYNSIINFFFDMSPISIAVRIPKNVKSWFNALKDRLSNPSGSILGIKRFIVQKFINVNNIDSCRLIEFSGKFTTIMKCIFESIVDPSYKETFFTNYYSGIRERFDQFSTIADRLQQDALDLVAEEVRGQSPSWESGSRCGPRGGSRATLKHKRKRRSNNKKTPLKSSSKNNKRRSSKNRRKR
jgi:hypothetical protein